MANDNEGATLPELLEPSPAPLMPSPARKPRGRPRGSKNKPQPPVVVTRESEAALRSVVLEVAAGCDVVAAVTAFARRRGVGVSVLCGRGAAAAVTLRLPTSPTTASTVTLHGRFEVLALSGTVMLQVPGGEAPPPAFSVSLAGSGGQVIGGMVTGEMTAAEDGMVVVAATFGSAEVHRLPAQDEDDGGPDDEQQVKPPHHPPQQQSMVVAAAGAGGVGLGGYSGVAAGLAAGGHVVGHYQQQTQMVFWPHPSSTGGPGPVQPFSHF
ncbi:hypothetical protein PR202_gb03726 [Eleusine coracana subsp. coracana]|uniref:AT-hook motif nuclear-localized protein n=1 Tax=Eleusine coracana subsp. coracana TaxID=191504 RepID=A0AAV5E2M0_ELECO|nr:hypothetical protein QOZ80_1BG0096770 [Eleusine coracana subsp. coracana]GJN16707.1 hypothetical protein PR202_gb03726 [Eleusine coracana subsp. coracana]